MDTATTEIYTDLHTLSLHDALPISAGVARDPQFGRHRLLLLCRLRRTCRRSESARGAGDDSLVRCVLHDPRFLSARRDVVASLKTMTDKTLQNAAAGVLSLEAYSPGMPIDELQNGRTQCRERG